MEIIPNSSSYLPNNSQSLTSIVDCQEYYLINENVVYKIIIGRNIYELFIKCKNYLFIFNQNDLSILSKIKFNSINEAYEFIRNIFEENQVFIKTININKEMKLILKNSNENEIKVTLVYNSQNSDFIFNEIKQLKTEIMNLKEENKKLKIEILKLRKYHENTNPKDMKLLADITNDSFGYTDLDNTFTVFKSIKNIFYIVYSNINKSMNIYDLNRQKLIKQINNCHNKHITNFRHQLDIINKRDLVMSVSSEDNNIKLWNANNWECFVNIENINYVGWLYSACFLNEKGQIYIITSNRNKQGKSEPIRIFDFNGYIIKEISNSNEQTYFIDTYYDNILCKNYIISGNVGYVKSYDYNKNELYYKYNDFDDNSNSYSHFSIIIRNNKEVIELIESCFDGNIRIWNFHSGLLLNKIKLSDEGLRGICLWNDNYLFVGCDDKTIKLLEINNILIVDNLTGHNNEVITVKKIIHPQLGECLISQNGGESQIKIWIKNK